MLEEVSKNVFFLQSPNESCNFYILVGKRLALIDSGLSSNSKLILDSLKQLGFTSKDVELVLHTHGHADHFSADSLFPKSRICMSEFDALRVSLKDSLFTCSEAFGETFFPKIHSFFQSKEVVSIPPFRLEVISTPGHTEGSVCFFEKSKGLLFSGDSLFAKGVGRFDLISGSRQKLLSSLELLSRLEFEALLPGHGGIFKGNQKENIKNSVETLFV